MEIEQENSILSTVDTVLGSRSEITTVHLESSEENSTSHYKILPPKASSPIQTNKASAPVQTHPQKTMHVNTKPISTTAEPEKALPQKQTLVEKLRVSADMSLKRLAPVTIAPSGRPRVVIPDSVFKKGAEIHQDFIICYFNGKSPPFNQIQSVFNFMWGKGKRLEIHNNPLNHSVIVRIQSSYLRQKILEKNIWYVGESMFHTAQWNTQHSMVTPPLKAIKIWAHLTGVPLDLRYDEGLSLVAGLIGEPKETDEFTKNMVSLTVSHVKVEVDLTKPLPPVVEFERESGEVVEVQVHYPWVPPTCSHCHELGHILRNCLTYIPPAPEYGKASTSKQKESQKPNEPLETSSTTQSDFTPAKTSRKTQKKYQPVPKVPVDQNPNSDTVQLEITEKAPSLPSSSHTHLPSPLPPDPILPLVNHKHFSTPEPTPRPSLKRSRSSPILSPPISSSANPFFVAQNLPSDQILTLSASEPLSSTPPDLSSLSTDLNSHINPSVFVPQGPPPLEDPPNPSL